ncbi:hypothetical protein GALMADRAFT_142236 [Galerina marginata CBS 339.88]|uniref:MYND-type domain-containing protein n=1 Tax=Galerina marginata (strain CBS 339.88) TaxID=685588 RepID=A0A067SSD6_GALM3|nr:hypothetical protein GALMADRAFT_142236 [Galerina marginata CBS 339.88]
MDSAQDTPPPVSHPVTERPIFALIIGINNYQDDCPPSLRGCVNDSKTVFAYLRDTLRVPETNIVLLHDEQATREKIIGTFESHFINNSAITPGDAIVFYFAGHGSRQKAPDGWHSEDDKVETICPYDVMNTSGIPDYTFTHLLRQLTFYKGNNITLILDSCHSGGMARAEMETGEEVPLIRCCDREYEFPPLGDLDRRIWSWNPEGGRSNDLPESELQGSLFKTTETHVLLAACQPNQRARETKNSGLWSGAFTTVLISALKAWDPSTRSLTYSRLMEHLSPLKDQHPHCEGDNKVRRLFSPSDDGKDDPSYFVVTAAATDDAYYVAAGNLLGIVEGTEFITHPPNGYAPITLKTKVVEKFRCTAVPCRHETAADSQSSSTSILPQHSRATISKWSTKWLKVELHPREAFSHIIEDEDTLFSIVDSGGDLKASRADSGSNNVQLSRNDPLIHSQQECRDISINFDTFTRHYIDKAARFHFFLYQGNSSTLRGRAGSDSPATPVTVSLHRLTSTTSLLGPTSFKPDGDNLFRIQADGSKKELAGTVAVEGSAAVKGSSLLEGSAVLEGSAADLQYGLTLKNHSTKDLFPYVFFFDPGKYDIAPLYLPPSSVSSPLTRDGTEGSTLGIGYTPGTNRMSFTMPEGVNHDSAFFKVFVSTEYINMKAIVANPGRTAQRSGPDRSAWDSWIYLVTWSRAYPATDALVPSLSKSNPTIFLPLNNLAQPNLQQRKEVELKRKLEIAASIKMTHPGWLTSIIESGNDIRRRRKQDNSLCYTCSAVGSDEKPVKVCAKCQVVAYCSKECQIRHWPKHKEPCFTSQDSQRSKELAKFVNNIMANPQLMDYFELATILSQDLINSPAIDKPFLMSMHLSIDPEDIVDFARLRGRIASSDITDSSTKIKGMVQVNNLFAAGYPGGSVNEESMLRHWRLMRATADNSGFTSESVGLMFFTMNNCKTFVARPIRIPSSLLDIAKNAPPFEQMMANGTCRLRPMDAWTCIEALNTSIRLDHEDRFLLRTEMTDADEKVIQNSIADGHKDDTKVRRLRMRMAREQVYTALRD